VVGGIFDHESTFAKTSASTEASASAKASAWQDGVTRRRDNLHGSVFGIPNGRGRPLGGPPCLATIWSYSGDILVGGLIEAALPENDLCPRPIATNHQPLITTLYPLPSILYPQFFNNELHELARIFVYHLCVLCNLCGLCVKSEHILPHEANISSFLRIKRIDHTGSIESWGFAPNPDASFQRQPSSPSELPSPLRYAATRCHATVLQQVGADRRAARHGWRPYGHMTAASISAASSRPPYLKMSSVRIPWRPARRSGPTFAPTDHQSQNCKILRI